MKMVGKQNLVFFFKSNFPSLDQELIEHTVGARERGYCSDLFLFLDFGDDLTLELSLALH